MSTTLDPTTPLFAPRFLARFSCLADKCPDTCCTSWRIDVDAEHFAKLEATLLADPAEHERFHRVFQRDPDGKFHRLIVLDDQRRCSYLTAANQCDIHAKHGESVLGNTCAMYPRVVVEIDGVAEASARLSCPEVARLCLLADDALDQLEVPHSTAGRGVIVAKLRSAAGTFLRPVRAAMASLLDRDAPLRTRLFFIGYLTTRFDALERDFAMTRDALERERAQLATPAAQRQLDRSLAEALDKTVCVAPQLLTVIFSARMQSAVSPAFQRLAEAVLRHDLSTAGLTAPADLREGFMLLGAARLGAQHEARRAQIAPDVHAALERALGNFVRYMVLYDSFTFPAMLPWFLDLALRVAMIRYLCTAELTLGVPFEAAIVNSVYAINRAFDHQRELIDTIARALEQTKMSTLAHGVSLLKF